jgi:hypothetical protein
MMSSATSTDDFKPWQFFTLIGLATATALVFMAVFVWHSERAAAIVLSVTVGAASFAGYTAWRTVAPLAGDEGEVSPASVSVGGRGRAVLEREKLLTLRAIKDLQFDRAMKKVSEKDFAEMGGRLRSRAAGLISQLDSAVSYRDEIDREVATRLGGAAAPVRARLCTGCRTVSDPDARFCKTCGAQLEAA